MLIPMSEYQSIIHKLTKPLDKRVTLPVSEAVGLVLADDVEAKLPIPRFTNSAMDGFLVRTDDGTARRTVVGDVPAGATALPVGPGEAVRIMTGAPTGDDEGTAVVPVEDTNLKPGPQALPSTIEVYVAPKPRAHVRPRADDVAVGDVVVAAGTMVDASALAAIISVGVSEVTCYPRPVVGVISSGDELASIEDLGEGQIPDSNGPMLEALAREQHCDVIRAHHSSDRPEDFISILDSLTESCDLVVTSGGVSAGAFDVVKEATQDSIGFYKVAQQPGKPQGCGLWKGTPIVCLPGNPVSAWVSFHLYVRDVICSLTGRDYALVKVPMSIDGPLDPIEERTRMFPVKVQGDRVVSKGAGSHKIGSLVGMNGLAIVPPGHTGHNAQVMIL
ncbi:molybdopterin molybdotransferase MoeA [Corynebacterium pyruviciproducens]|nr:gephyrin-like molybdotransferase Glp [Corynebacterium pyruviciproducens]